MMRMAINWPQITVRIQSAGRVRCEPGWRLGERHTAHLRDCDFWFVWAGRGSMRLSESDIDLRPGRMIWMRPGTRYIAEQDPDDRLGVTFIHFDLLRPSGKALLTDRELPPQVHDLADVQYVDAVGRRIVDLHHRHGPRGSSPRRAAVRAAEALLRGVLIDIESGLTLPQPVEDGLSPGTQMHHYRIISAIASRITESPQAVGSVADLAREAGYSADHFTRVFKRIIGRTPQQFLVEARMSRARQLLNETGLSITQIASAVGYDEVYAFSNQFKQHAGRSPSAYRKG